MELLNKLDTQLQALAAQSLIRTRRTVETPCAPRVTVDGRELLAFCSNDYLGLAAHPAIAAALQEGADRYGTGSGASHLISGHSRAHVALEERLAAFESPYLVDARALTFCTGYMANLAVITGLAGVDKNTEIFSEALNHASLIDGARLARTGVKVYPHADVEALAALLEASSATNKIVVTDSVFSMDGDLAPLPALLALCERHDAWLVVDDAHGFGTLGDNGHGALEHFELRSPNLVYMGTLGKAAGVGGAFVAAHATVIETLVQRARPYIFTTAAPPALAHALLTSLDIIEGPEGRRRRNHLQALVAQWRECLALRRWQPLASETAIQPIVIGPNDETMRASAALYEQGFWVGGIRPPTVPADTARLRVTFSAAHTEAEVAALAAALNQLERT
ncbi:8-amino-7-oxononanoate synthase [Pseudoduganella buxea]|uniref:8-amino-7-oxononanoate synthase n=1 Tax=Pseudoduganella buxea TaxID=1949069 RepID=A0A6I3SQE0_9BURK|nr:8-amino-7-oxononanoate synthase [Pseudoduganella buxea]MTV51261.1 8-amino-7-oxononanoate synthase [Pseudoduganella buxea]GGB97027.1 8-amino-7-oxononanoate synthase [Pseudoduganella buxea]